MFSSPRSRNIFLISAVAISHLLVLLSLMSGSLVGRGLEIPGVLMVNLAGERVGASSRQQFSAKPQTSSVSNGKYISSSTSNDSPSLGDSRGVGHEAKGDARSVIYNPKPLYPLASRRLGEQGLVIVRMCVNEHGLVKAVEVFKSSGFEGLDRSALNTLAQWRFAPIAENFISLSAQCFQTPIQFSLEV